MGGIILLILGVTGSTSWTAKILGAESILADAAPGVLLFIVGLFIVYITRYKLKVRSELETKEAVEKKVEKGSKK